MSDWFNARKDAIPDGAMMAKLPAALQVSGHWLLTGEGASVAGGDGSLKTAERAGAQKVIGELARVVEQLRLVHAVDDASPRVAKRIEKSRRDADRARVAPAGSGRRKSARPETTRQAS